MKQMLQYFLEFDGIQTFVIDISGALFLKIFCCKLTIQAICFQNLGQVFLKSPSAEVGVGKMLQKVSDRRCRAARSALPRPASLGYCSGFQLCRVFCPFLSVLSIPSTSCRLCSSREVIMPLFQKSVLNKINRYNPVTEERKELNSEFVFPLKTKTLFHNPQRCSEVNGFVDSAETSSGSLDPVTCRIGKQGEVELGRSDVPGKTL